MAESGLGIVIDVCRSAFSRTRIHRNLAPILRTLQWTGRCCRINRRRHAIHRQEICHQAHMVVRFPRRLVALLVYVARWCVPAHSSCIGNNTAAHELVHLVGMPPGGHSTPVVQQLSVTVWMNARNSGKDAQLAGAVGTVGAVSQTRTPRK